MNVTATTTIHDLVDAYPYLLDWLVELQLALRGAQEPGAVRDDGARRQGRDRRVRWPASTPTSCSTTSAPRSRATRSSPRRPPARPPRRSTPRSPPRARRRSRPSSASCTTACRSSRSRRSSTRSIVGVDSAEIARMEQALIAEGMPVEDVQRLCDVHVTVFKESLDEKPSATVAAGHPIDAYMRENEVATQLVADAEPRCSARWRPPPTTPTAPRCSRPSRRSSASSRRSTRTTRARRTSCSRCSRRTASRGRPRSCGRSTTTSAAASRPRARCWPPATRPRSPRRCPRRSR